jgi:hypothetical protein
MGRIRFVNLITDPARNPVNAILEGLPFGVSLAYTGSTPSSLPAPSTAIYSPILEGARTLVLKKTADTTVTVATLPVTIAANNDHTVFATGGTAGGAVSAFVTVDVNTAPPTGQARIRVVNMSPTAGAVDVFITARTRISRQRRGGDGAGESDGLRGRSGRAGNVSDSYGASGDGAGGACGGGEYETSPVPPPSWSRRGMDARSSSPTRPRVARRFARSH